jgi:hypothetical protein
MEPTGATKIPTIRAINIPSNTFDVVLITAIMFSTHPIKRKSVSDRHKRTENTIGIDAFILLFI